MIKKLLGFVFCCVTTIGSIAQKWTPDGTAFYANENSVIVKYQLPAFTRTEIILAKQLTPAGTSQPLNVKDYEFSADVKTLLIYTNSKKVWRRETRGDYWVLDIASNTLKQLGKDKPASSLMFAKISPDGKMAAYVSGHNIYTEDLASGTVKALTTDGTDRMINGTFDWAYEEEFGCHDGFRWSPDGKHIAYWQIDASKIKNFLMINNTDSLYSFVVPVEYPKAGEDPSPCKIGVVDVATAATKWMDVPGDSRQHYIPRMEWAANSTEVILEQINRRQNEAKVFICDVNAGSAKEIYSETEKVWMDVNDSWKGESGGWEFTNGGKDFYWLSEKDGWRHLYRISRDGSKQTLITKGSFDVINVKAVDEKAKVAYIIASPENATQKYLYKVSLDGKSKMELLSPVAQKGTHSYSMSPNGMYASHNFSNHLNQRLSEWVSLPKHQTIKAISSQMDIKEPAKGRLPEMFQITTDDGITMDGWIVKPKDFDSTKKYPVLFFVYAEPAGATVKDEAGSANIGIYGGDLAADGYLQISLDGRGTPSPKGAAWRKAIYQKIGIVNIRDQAMGAKKIMQWPFVDTSRIAVHGWSGGGSTTLNLLFQYPEIYKTGIAVASVPNQLLYDNIYQERYMGLPQENKQPYIDGSPITHAKNLRGNLLVVHGTGDDNVHYQGVEMLINELVKNGKQFQLMTYPNRTHAIREGKGTYEHLQQLFKAYLNEHCPGGGR